ncbi:MAG: CPBP family intramembrane metalloprotease [Oscillospiraceae bacterium]|nr:CPBP family intramembrane metalloprotease [Oscillospiraceae bacterium]
MEKQNTRRILTYLLITFCLTWGYCFLILYPMVNGETLNGLPSVAAQLLTAICMFFPAIGVLLTRLITKEGFRNCWLKPNFKKNIKTYLLAWFGPGILTLAGAALYFLLFPDNLDFSFSYFITTLESAGAPLETLPMPIELLMVIQCLQALFLAPAMNFIVCFGEEWGWRGYLLPKMKEKLPTVPMLLVTGIIWGLWHAPLTAIGHNYGVGYPGFPFAGIGMMCLFCIVLGVFMSYVTLKTGSCIPAVLAHGAVNGIGAIGIYLTKDGGNPFIGPAPMGIIGLIPFMIVAMIMAIRLSRREN